MDSGDPKSNRGWRTRGTFQERSTRADRVSVAVRETRVTGGRSTSGLAAEARAAVEPAIARDPVRKAAEETRQRTRRDRFSTPLHTVCDSRFVPTRLVGSLRFVTQPTRRLDVVVALSCVHLSFGWQNLSRERYLPDCVSRRADARVRRLTPCRPTRTRFWRSSSSTSRSGYVFTSASGRVARVRPRNAFSRRRRPRAAIVRRSASRER